ncbi:glycosyltransferase family 2 protein [Haematospirillum jordaniae]|uniref:Dolichol-phosphate mannosyltransferase n=1 Tax=Haematospirillum jordaniae TaxID=1549855 RepID=A0A143DDC5_9PROT|nr:glycosyltransferase family 2 protein [Haematospirillum jordaniae]AMW34732.1 dolichol-phosphate mannosyltransferase [Haematospirillum jordaniae]NKD56915.1 glycosyltransferase family 2 protein [Haematospirillum jordaniae]NKD58929.1 glycosyltransferase family 2 protein [Haematospirillum jordaniae]NKD66840.1 glycosyltransferase family 2 protein [Haematospirillum jordaniae]NKD78931.1 glycosyltransferase family 2 protein [Haematospirillum jordaniae]
MTEPSRPDLSVVVPVHNEADNILPLIEEIAAALDGVVPFEIVYVDDGSNDATPHRLTEARARFPALRCVRHRTACGQSQAIYTGVLAARGTWIATLDGDGQNDPADIPALLTRLRDEEKRTGMDATRLLIAGHRQKRQDNELRRLSSRIGNGVRAWLLNDGTPDTGCGLKLFARSLFLKFPRFDHMHRYLPALTLREGGLVVSVPVNHRPRERGVSKYGVWNRLWVSLFDLVGVMWLQRRARNPVLEQQD